MSDDHKRDRNSKIIGWSIAVIAVIIFISSFILGAGT